MSAERLQLVNEARTAIYRVLQLGDGARWAASRAHFMLTTETLDVLNRLERLKAMLDALQSAPQPERLASVLRRIAQHCGSQHGDSVRLTSDGVAYCMHCGEVMPAPEQSAIPTVKP